MLRRWVHRGPRAAASVGRWRELHTSLNSHPSSEELEKRAVYLDAQATQPVDPRVLDAMLPYLIDQFGNPHSRTHEYGWSSEQAVDRAREQVRSLINARQTREIIFTSGATESNNIAIKGVARFYKETKKHIITLQTEHKCVLESCRQLEGEGFEVTFLPVLKDGTVDLKVLEAAMRPDTSLVSVMAVNNEIGVIQPLAEIGALCRSKKITFHTDAAQAVGKIPMDVEAMNIDVMSISGHKVYGPKGVGVLYVRRRPRVRLTSPVSGGGQERGVRSGTVPTPLCVAMGAACEVAAREMKNDAEHQKRLATRLWEGLTKRLPEVYINGPPLGAPNRYDGNLNISFDCVEGESLLMGINKVAVSSGSACTSASLEPSYVLRALGVSEAVAHTSLRFGIGRFTTEKEIDYAIDVCSDSVTRLREMSPLWEAKMEGKEMSIEFS